jgi:hypothetical protein
LSARKRPVGDFGFRPAGRSGDRKMTIASRMSSGPLSARNGAKAGEIFVSLVMVVVKYVFSIGHILVVQKSCGGRDNDTPTALMSGHTFSESRFFVNAEAEAKKAKRAKRAKKSLKFCLLCLFAFFTSLRIPTPE